MKFSPHAEKKAQPSRFNSIIVSMIMVFALIIQQGAFVSLPLVMSGIIGTEKFEQFGGVDQLNTVTVAASLALIVILCLSHARDVILIFTNNIVPTLFTFLILASTIWSNHPDLTIRRGVGYVLTILISAYLSARFRFHDIAKLLSLSFAISAIASFLFVAAFPEYGRDYSGVGVWRGVWPHKEMLGTVMAVAIFSELYIMVDSPYRSYWRFGLLAIFLALLRYSGAKTPLLLALEYMIGAGVYLLWRRNYLIGWALFVPILAALGAILGILLIDPEGLLGILGKDPTLTGRTELWSVVVNLIEQKPILGWGYRAVFHEGDSISAQVNELVGWSVPSAHNGFLEVTLELGLLGVVLLGLMICQALWRGFRCRATGHNPLGWFSLMYFFGTILSAQTLDNLAQNQIIDWVVFNILLFSCGKVLTRSRATSSDKLHRARVIKPQANSRREQMKSSRRANPAG